MRQTTSDIARRSVSRRSFMIHAASAAAALTLPAGALAQASWPSRTITLVVPFPPGGQADLAARPVAAALAKTLGQSVVVENKSGAGGALGAAAVAKAEPDGHTLLLTLNSLVISPPAERLYDRTPLYEVNQFVPIARVLSDPNILVVKATSPWKTIGEFVEDAKRRPGEITFSSSGNYGAAHVSVELFAQAAGIKLLHVPYRGAGPAITGLLGDQVALTSTTAGTLAAQQEAGLVRFLATMSSERLPRFPSVPTLARKRYPGSVPCLGRSARAQGDARRGGGTIAHRDARSTAKPRCDIRIRKSRNRGRLSRRAGLCRLDRRRQQDDRVRREDDRQAGRKVNPPKPVLARH